MESFQEMSLSPVSRCLYLLIWGEGGLKTSEALLEILLTDEHFCRPKKKYISDLIWKTVLQINFFKYSHSVLS